MIERELTRRQFNRRHPGVELQHGGIKNKCVGDGKHVFLCFDCDRWTCECCGGADEPDDEPLCSPCWVRRAKAISAVDWAFWSGPSWWPWWVWDRQGVTVMPYQKAFPGPGINSAPCLVSVRAAYEWSRFHGKAPS